MRKGEAWWGAPVLAHRAFIRMYMETADDSLVYGDGKLDAVGRRAHNPWLTRIVYG